MYSLLERNITKHLELAGEEIGQFCRLFVPKKYRKRDFFLQEGEVCSYEGFVTKGLFRVYHLDQRGLESILYFASEDWWITDIDSFTSRRSSSLFIEALEDSEVLSISKDDKELAYKNYPGIEKLFRVMTQKTHVALQKRMIDSLSKTAEQRYIDFINRYPGLQQRLSNKQIASYLGISHEFLSKIRKNLSQKK